MDKNRIMDMRGRIAAPPEMAASESRVPVDVWLTCQRKVKVANRIKDASQLTLKEGEDPE